MGRIFRIGFRAGKKLCPAPGRANLRIGPGQMVCAADTKAEAERQRPSWVSCQSMSVPEPVARLAELMSTFPGPWYLCGGWAVDAWLGRQTREHGDVDFAVFQDDQRALFDHLSGWQTIGHDNSVDDASSEPWNRRWLDLPAHIHARPEARDATDGSLYDADQRFAHNGADLDIQLNERSGEEWVLNREPRVAMPLDRCAGQSAWGVPTVVPQVILFYKAYSPVWRDTPRAAPRPHDELDFFALLPQLTADQRLWTWEAISSVDPAHPWLTQLRP